MTFVSLRDFKTKRNDREPGSANHANANMKIRETEIHVVRFGVVLMPLFICITIRMLGG